MRFDDATMASEHVLCKIVNPPRQQREETTHVRTVATSRSGFAAVQTSARGHHLECSMHQQPPHEERRHGLQRVFFVGLVHLRTRPQKKMAGRAYVHPVPQRNSDPPRLENPGSPCQGSVSRLQLFFLRRNIGFHDESSEYCGYSSSEASNPVRSNPVKYEYQRSKTR